LKIPVGMKGSQIVSEKGKLREFINSKSAIKE
jgi:hypothetical protein